MFATLFLAASSLPQINIVGLPPANCGLTIRAFPTELNAFTKWASVNSRCSISINESSRLVKNFSTPLPGGASAMGLVVSIIGLPDKFFLPAKSSTSFAAEPLTAKTTTSPKAAAYWKLPIFPSGLFEIQSASFLLSRLPTIVS
jgi:hypothetical protein